MTSTIKYKYVCPFCGDGVLAFLAYHPVYGSAVKAEGAFHPNGVPIKPGERAFCNTCSVSPARFAVEDLQPFTIYDAIKYNMFMEYEG